MTPAGLGAMGVNLRYLEESGAARAEGLAAIGLSGVVTFLVRLATAIAVVVVAGHSGLDAVVHLAPAQVLLVLGAILSRACSPCGADVTCSNRRGAPGPRSVVCAGARAASSGSWSVREGRPRRTRCRS